MQNIPVQDDPDGIVRAQVPRRAVVVKTDNYTVVAADNNKIFTATDAADQVTFTLPAPTKGMRFTFQKGTADTDINIQMPSGVKINFGTAAKKYKAVTDADGVPVVATVFSDGTDYFIESQVGTWANDNT